MPFLSDSKDTYIRGGTFTDMSGNGNYWDNSYRAYNSHNRLWTGSSPNKGSSTTKSTSGVPSPRGARRNSGLGHPNKRPSPNTPHKQTGGDGFDIISSENIQILLPDLDDETVRLLEERGFFESFKRKPEPPAGSTQDERNPWEQATRPSEHIVSSPPPNFNPRTNPLQYKSNNPFRALLNAQNPRAQAL